MKIISVIENEETSGFMSTRSISPRRRLCEPEARDAPLLIFEFVRRAGGLVYLHADGFASMSADFFFTRLLYARRGR